jgi:thiamine-phosphate pyrophosphorylase
VRRGLYAIVDLEALGGRDPLAFADALLAAGALFALQLRAKVAPARVVLDVSRALAHRCARADVPFYVNDRPDLAWLAGASGVHVGQEDLGVVDARRVAPGLAVGLSSHDETQAARGLAAGVDYLAFGPVFPTVSKRDPDPVVGTQRLACVAAQAGTTPVVAIGGITLERAPLVRAAGAAAGAVIAALARAPEEELTARARALHRALGGE